MGTSIAGTISSDGLPEVVAAPPNEKSALPLPFAGTVTSMVFSVPTGAGASCQATTVYLPAGRPLIVKVPSSALTAKNGVFMTPIKALIHGC